MYTQIYVYVYISIIVQHGEKHKLKERETAMNENSRTITQVIYNRYSRIDARNLFETQGTRS